MRREVVKPSAKKIIFEWEMESEKDMRMIFKLKMHFKIKRPQFLFADRTLFDKAYNLTKLKNLTSHTVKLEYEQF